MGTAAGRSCPGANILRAWTEEMNHRGAGKGGRGLKGFDKGRGGERDEKT